MKLFPYIDFLTHVPNCSHRSVSWSDPRKQVRLCFNLHFASLAGLPLEIPITTVFSFAKASANAENCVASMVQWDVSAREKNTTTFLPICSVKENHPRSV